MPYMLNYNQMGSRILECRQAQNMTQGELAKRVGVSTSFIGHLERTEKIPSLETVASLCAALDVSMDYLVFGRKGQYCDRLHCELYEEIRAVMENYRDWRSE